MVRVLLGLLMLSAAATQPAKTDPSVKPDVSAELTRLRQLQLTDVGRGSLVESYEKLIAAAGDDPKAADAMMDLAALWETRTAQAPAGPGGGAEVVPPRRRDRRPGIPRVGPQPVLHRLAGGVEQPGRGAEGARRGRRPDQGRPGHAGEVENSLIDVSLRENKLDEAESHARTVLGWYDAPGHTPADAEGKQAVDGMIAGAAGEIIDAIAPAPLPADARIARIKRLMEDFPTVSAVQSEGGDAIKQLQSSQQAGTN